MSYFYTCVAIYFILMAMFGIWETIYLKRTKKDDHPSRYVNEVFYEEIMKQDE